MPIKRMRSKRSITSACTNTSKSPGDNEDLRLIIRNGLEKTILLKQLEEKIREVERAQRDLSDVQKDILRVFA